MHRAVEKNMLDIVDMFLQCGGDPTIQNKNGFTLLHVAAKHGYLEMCKLLVAKGKFDFHFESQSFNFSKRCRPKYQGQIWVLSSLLGQVKHAQRGDGASTKPSEDK